ncbi:MAG: hypothetical protein ACRDOH_32965, partial [Streptosporangiaceae bacterium]
LISDPASMQPATRAGHASCVVIRGGEAICGPAHHGRRGRGKPGRAGPGRLAVFAGATIGPSS